MKKIFLFIASLCAFASCDPVHEDFSNEGHITVDELISQTVVALDKSSDGKNGNVVTCETSAPVVAKWEIKGKQYIGNYAKRKMSATDVGQERTVVLTALCADGTTLNVEYPFTVETLTDPLKTYYVYDGDDFTVEASGDAAETRFSDNEGKHFPFIKDEVYTGLKTLIFEIKDCQGAEGGLWDAPAGPATLRVMNGWWSAVYYDDVEITEPGLWELNLTEEIAKDCAASGAGKDLTLLVKRGSITFGKVFYEE